MSGSQQLLLGTGVSAVAANYIEDVFSTWLYTGNNGDQTITNGIDLSTKGGLVWMKSRNDTQDHYWWDTNRGNNKYLASNLTAAQGTFNGIAFNTNGFTDKLAWSSSTTVASWTFRKQPKFFDVVTYTGNGGSQTISHSLGSAPGCIIIKKLDSTTFNAGWAVYHRSLTNPDNYYLVLNTTAAQTNYGAPFISSVSSTSFTVDGASGFLGLNGSQYVAYLFAHNAGGFGLTGTDNVISCGGGTFDSNGYAVVNLGYEPQWVLIKSTTYADNWYLADTMRGTTALLTSGTNSTNLLYPNLSNAETATSYGVVPSATGFTYLNGSAGQGYIYIAIRRGPMKTPTTGTSVFSPVYATSASSPYTVTTNFPVDSVISTSASSISSGRNVNDRLRGGTTTSFNTLFTDTTAAESVSSGSSGIGFQSNASVIDNGYWAGYGLNVIYWNFRRAPGFFDVVCYTGDSANGRSITHNLGVVPEMLIVKKRSSGAAWPTLITSDMRVMEINIDSGYKSAASTKFYYGNGSSDIPPTASAFTVASGGDVNGSGSTYVAYLFASCPGVSKIGSYTGTGALQTINCGFTGGARFVLIKRTDSTGGWFVYDSARGISSGNDPYLLLDVADAEVTGTNYVDTTSVGFQVTAAAPAELNSNGGTYIFLAIA